MENAIYIDVDRTGNEHTMPNLYDKLDNISKQVANIMMHAIIWFMK